MLWILPQAHN